MKQSTANTQERFPLSFFQDLTIVLIYVRICSKHVISTEGENYVNEMSCEVQGLRLLLIVTLIVTRVK